MFNNILSMQEPYQAVVVEEKWGFLEQFFDDDEGFSISCPIMTVARDNVFHIAVHSKSEQPLKHLLERVANSDFKSDHMFADVLNTTNAYENTVLHEAAINHNIKAVKLLVREGYVTPDQLLERNESGQTPLFKAAAFGSTKVVKYLASRPNQTGYERLVDAHRINKDGFSILHAAVRGEHFGTALELLKLDPGLAELKTKNGMTSLHLLTNLRSAFTTKFRDHLGHRLLYLCIPIGNDNCDDADNIFDDSEVGDNQNPSPQGKISKVLETINKLFWNYFIKVLGTIYKSFWNCFIKDDRCSTARKIWVEKRKLKFAFKLAHELIKNDHSWDLSYTQDTTKDYRSSASDKPSNASTDVPKQVNENEQSSASDKPSIDVPKPVIEKPSSDSYEASMQEIKKEPSSASDKPSTDVPKQVNEKEPSPITDLITDIPIVEELVISIEEIIKVETPLLAATRTGVTELVKKILKMHPQAVEHVSHKKQNILHLAASYRRREIFEYVKKMEIPTRRLIMGIDEDGYTVLHHVADNSNCKGGTSPGPAYQLQEELEWFQRVVKIMPSYFTQHIENKTDKTAEELFRVKHETQLEAAQKWIKETSQSCSGVAVLVATVVFAAAFTVPGGNRGDNGLPILLNSPFFLFFTVMDVVSLSCSLTAVVMFLSIVTSPFELDNFRLSLPRRLTLGFALLFMSVATTMLAFTSTIILIIRSDQRRRWTLTLICSAAFVPVSVLALTHFPLFVSFISAWKNIFDFIWMALPCGLLLRILKFLGKLVHRLGLRFLKFLCNY